ncbi:MAG TPA: hypothetical protein VN612_07615, partial [Acidobacteriaceae bacterium]|nr:hypothetical protein [Acidobacteriaceae bacterium]
MPTLHRLYVTQRGSRGTTAASPLSRQRYLRNAAIVLGLVVLVVWTAFPFVWILMTSLKSSADIISVPPKFVFRPTADNYFALFLGNRQGQYSSTRPDFPSYFLNSVIIS